MPLLLHFDTDRILAIVATGSSRGRTRSAAVVDRHVWSHRSAPPLAARPTDRIANPPAADDDRRAALEQTLATALIGDIGVLADVFTDDVQIWSPTMSVVSRAALAEVLEDVTSALIVSSFHVDLLWWSDPVVFAEWHLTARQATPLLIGEDVLVDGRERTVSFGGHRSPSYGNGGSPRSTPTSTELH